MSNIMHIVLDRCVAVSLQMYMSTYFSHETVCVVRLQTVVSPPPVDSELSCVS